MKKVKQKFADLLNGQKVISMLSRIDFLDSNYQLIDVKIKVLKNFKDQLTVIYDLVFKNIKGDIKNKKVFGFASSDKNNRYHYYITNKISKSLAKNFQGRI